ncbi:response regulator [Mesobacillus foraminis]|uniref:Two-component system response regulator YesN n=1 Tax=Mesobacillus foraminis TaxID=279826 RepID=A0A4R2BJZ4_9BACI|nr:response regulator [Mesobacillus foraminis]TCN26294.1 two-component system response regulator YesN [Mesobacillus foraminis]
MKVLIVDDEEDVRQSIRLLIPWSEYGIETVLEAQDGNDAVEIIEAEKPEVIFTDMMMPGKNGTELLTWLQSNHYNSKTIVISGHDDFQYVQHTLKNGGLDYILKPIDRNEIIKSFENALNNWKAEEEKRLNEVQRSQVITRSKPVFLDKMFSNLMLQPLSSIASYEELNKEFNLKNYKQFQIALLSTDMLQEKVINKFSNHFDLLDSSLLNVCNEILGPSSEGYAFKHLNKENEIVILIWKNFEHLTGKLQEINGVFTKILQTPFHFGISCIHPLPQGFQTGYKEAKLALRQSNYLTGDQFIHFYQGKDVTKSNTLFYSDYSEGIVIAIKSNGTEQIEKAVGKFIQAVKQLDTVTLDQLEYWRHEFYLMKSYLFKEIFFEEKVELRYKHVYFPLETDGRLSLDLFQQQLTEYCKMFASQLTEELQKTQNIIFDIKAYIDNHYHENLQLQSIADQFFLSREYVSRKFKQEFGINASDYIEKTRIDHAKILLTNHHLPVSDVATAVGYQDGRYFSKVFKKAVGVTPMKYKRSFRDEMQINH